MGIRTSTFGGVRLSGEEAEKFVRQVKYGRPSKAASESAKRGKVMLNEYENKGFVTIAVKRSKRSAV